MSLFDAFAGDTTALIIVSFGVGIVIGLTGMGGGALMTPALIFLGIPPTAAISNDLVAAAANKTVAAAVHLRQGYPDRRIAGLLICGSVPMAFLGASLVKKIETSGLDVEGILKTVIGVALLLAAGTFSLRIFLLILARVRGREAPSAQIQVKVVPTILVGMLGGFMVGLSSVGSGTLIMVVLMLVYPALSSEKLVGTDLLQAVPLVVAAAIGHVLVTGVDLAILLPLIIGGVPGSFLGARLTSFVSVGVIRRGLVIVLSLSGLALLGTSPRVVGAVGIGMLIVGPLLWAALRMLIGLPPRQPKQPKSPGRDAQPSPGAR